MNTRPVKLLIVLLTLLGCIVPTWDVAATDGRVLAWAATLDTTDLNDLQAEFPSDLRTGTWSPERAWNRYRDHARRVR